MRASLAGWSKGRLRLWLGLFFLALAVPTAVLVYQAYGQIKWEAFHQLQALAGELASRIDRRFQRLIDAEEARSFGDYGFLVVAGDPSANFLQRSALSSYPVTSEIPGLIGYFQVDAAGELDTPLLPQAGSDPGELGISEQELEQRTALADRLRRILGQNRLVQARATAAEIRPTAAEARRRHDKDKDKEVGGSGFFAGSRVGSVASRNRAAALDEEGVMPQAAFDRLSEAVVAEAEKKQQVSGPMGRVEDLKLDYRYQQAAPAPAVGVPDTLPRQLQSGVTVPLEKRGGRRERSALPELPAPDSPRASMADEVREAEAPDGAGLRIRIFESEIDPFEFALLDSGHFVLFRKVWRDGQRYIQGALIEQQPLLRGIVEASLRETLLSQTSDLVVAWQQQVLSVFSGQGGRGDLSTGGELRGAALYQTRLSAPLGDLELLFSINRLPAGPGSAVIGWLAAILAVVLCGGVYAMYRLGVRQIALARQQQDFVSAVSHELKTPLTSIRMYGEMLREGWASEEKKRSYYDYIHDESERLSRLITNVLQLARMTRNELKLDPRPATAGELMDGIHSKVASQAEHAGFRLNLECANGAAHAIVVVDADAFSQIVINLVDNAIKFAARAETRAIDILCHATGDGEVRFSVRDYGPGVARNQIKKIFRLFYRSENELTRETVGTGIGLALVNQLAQAMKGKVDVVNREPGVEFRVSFPATG
jgi:two-component system phosphate regulon sensor histidine kinase PhoR